MKNELKMKEKVSKFVEGCFEKSKLWNKVKPVYDNMQIKSSVMQVFIISSILGIIGGLLDSWCQIQSAKLPTMLANGLDVTAPVVALISVYIINAVDGVLSRGSMKLLRNKVINDKSYALIGKEFEANFRYILNSHTGKMTAEINGYVDCCSQLAMYWKRMIFFIPQIIVLFYKVATVVGYCAVLIDIAIIVAMTIYGYFGFVGFSYKKEIEANSEIRRISQDNMQSIKTLRYLNKKDFAMKRLEAAQNKAVVYSMMLGRQGVFGVISTATAIIPIINMAIKNKGNITVEDMTFILLSASATLVYIVDMAIDMMDLYSRKSDYAVTINELCKEEENIATEDIAEGIEINDVDFGYVESDIIMHIENLTIERGKRYVITGESGQGKSTFANLLVGTLEPIHGSIKKVRTFYIHQDTDCLDSSIRDNICFGDDIPDETIYYYLDRVGLGDWVRNLPSKLETAMGERGAKASSGQKQRLNILRAVFKMKELDEECLIILDEPTSNLDNETEKLACELINEVCKNTLVVVTHRPAIKSICDHEIRVENHAFTMLD